MGKWYTAISDFRKGQQMQKKPPLFKKLFNAGSVEEEALQLLIHEKKIIEQEKALAEVAAIFASEYLKEEDQNVVVPKEASSNWTNR